MNEPVFPGKVVSALMVRTGLLFALLITGCAGSSSDRPTTGDTVPGWARDAIFYQIFPERFRNGDPGNDPTRESLEYHADVPASWKTSSWTADWYARDPWEVEKSDDFYDTVYHRRYGGDLQGVIDELPYVRSLGVDAVYFNPVFWARSMHKYDGNSFHHIDPYFGPTPAEDLVRIREESETRSPWVWTSADSLFLEVIEEAHSQGLRVVIDGVFNHSGRDFFAFQDLKKNQANSFYADWYVVRSFDNPDTPENEFAYKGWFDVESLPEFADTPDGSDLHPGPKAYIFEATARWMDPNEDGDPSDGVDGWRLDAADQVPVGFWADWNQHVRSINPDAYTVTEVWENPYQFVADGGFSGVMNYFGFSFPMKGFLVDQTLSASGFSDLIASRLAESVPYQYGNFSILDSHDTDRLPSMMVNRGQQPYERPERFDYNWGNHASPRGRSGYRIRKPDSDERQLQRLAVLFQMTYVGIPTVYYGEEAGMWSGSDPDNRMPMVWPDFTYDPQTHSPYGDPRQVDSISFDSTMFNYYREVIALRRGHAALRGGSIRMIDVGSDLVGFVREESEERLLVLINRSDSTRIATLTPDDAGLGTGEGLYNVFNSAPPNPGAVFGTDGLIRVSLEPHTGSVFIRTGEE